MERPPIPHPGPDSVTPRPAPSDSQVTTVDSEELRGAARHLRTVADHVQSDAGNVVQSAADPGGDHAIDAVVLLQRSAAAALDASAGRLRRAAADLDLTAERWVAAESGTIGTGP